MRYSAGPIDSSPSLPIWNADKIKGRLIDLALQSTHGLLSYNTETKTFSLIATSDFRSGIIQEALTSIPDDEDKTVVSHSVTALSQLTGLTAKVGDLAVSSTFVYLKTTNSNWLKLSPLLAEDVEIEEDVSFSHNVLLDHPNNFHNLVDPWNTNGNFSLQQLVDQLVPLTYFEWMGSSPISSVGQIIYVNCLTTFPIEIVTVRTYLSSGGGVTLTLFSKDVHGDPVQGSGGSSGTPVFTVAQSLAPTMSIPYGIYPEYLAPAFQQLYFAVDTMNAPVYGPSVLHWNIVGRRILQPPTSVQHSEYL